MASRRRSESITRRDAALRRLTRMRALAAGVTIALTLAFVQAAADAFPGRTASRVSRRAAPRPVGAHVVSPHRLHRTRHRAPLVRPAAAAPTTTESRPAATTTTASAPAPPATTASAPATTSAAAAPAQTTAPAAPVVSGGS